MQTLTNTQTTTTLLNIDFMTIDDMYDDVAIEELVAVEYNED